MGIVTAEEIFDNNGMPPANADDARRNGLKFLGDKILQDVAGSTRRRQYANGMTKAIRKTVNKKVPAGAAQNAGENRFQVFYEYEDSGAKKKQIVAAVRFKTQVICTLDGVNRPLVLNIRMDVRDDDGLEMDVVFPGADDGNNFQYLSTASNDVDALQGGQDGKNYLAAFKFLSRCK